MTTPMVVDPQMFASLYELVRIDVFADLVETGELIVEDPELRDTLLAAGAAYKIYMVPLLTLIEIMKRKNIPLER